MLSITGAPRVRNCQGWSRRELLRVGSLSLGGLALPGLLAARAQAAPKPLTRPKSVVLLFLMGGPPQVETFDPKFDVPVEYRSAVGETPTKLPGVYFGGTFPKLAARADRLAIVRSFGAGKGGLSHEAGYDRILQGGENSFRSPLGALYARVAGPIHPQSGIPAHVVVQPESIDPTLALGNPSGAFTRNQVGRYFLEPGKLGPEYKPFDPSVGGALLDDLRLNLPQGRLDDRRALLSEVDTLRRQLDATRELSGVNSFQEQAYDVLLRGISSAFDLSREDPRTLERYDTSRLVHLAEIHRGGRNFWNNFSRATNLLGKQMLLARRLCEAGCGFVTVIDQCWDFHNDGNNPPVSIGMNTLGPQLDHAVAAFLDDLAERGLSDEILLVITAEMGRTPRKGGGGAAEKRGIALAPGDGGTGHWGDLTPLVLAGGGLRMGQVVGQSDRLGAFPATNPYGPRELMATVMHTLLNVGEVRVSSELPSDLVRFVSESQPIAELF